MLILFSASLCRRTNFWMTPWVKMKTPLIQIWPCPSTPVLPFSTDETKLMTRFDTFTYFTKPQYIYLTHSMIHPYTIRVLYIFYINNLMLKQYCCKKLKILFRNIIAYTSNISVYCVWALSSAFIFQVNEIYIKWLSFSDW